MCDVCGCDSRAVDGVDGARLQRVCAIAEMHICVGRMGTLVACTGKVANVHQVDAMCNIS